MNKLHSDYGLHARSELVNAYLKRCRQQDELRKQRDELLAACETLLAAGETGMMSDWYPAREKAHAAIAKVKAVGD